MEAPDLLKRADVLRRDLRQRTVAVGGLIVVGAWPVARRRAAFSRLYDIRPRIGDEAVVVRHHHLGQAPGIHHHVFSDDAVEVQDVRHDRVDFSRRQQSRLIEGHRPIDVVPDRRRLRPETPDRLERPGSGERAFPADERGAYTAAFTVRTVAARAASGVDRASFGDGSRAVGQAAAVRRDGSAEAANFVGSRRPSDAEAGRLRRKRCGAGERGRQRQRATRPHWSPSHRPERARTSCR